MSSEIARNGGPVGSEASSVGECSFAGRDRVVQPARFLQCKSCEDGDGAAVLGFYLADPCSLHGSLRFAVGGGCLNGQ